MAVALRKGRKGFGSTLFQLQKSLNSFKSLIFLSHIHITFTKLTFLKFARRKSTFLKFKIDKKNHFTYLWSSVQIAPTEDLAGRWVPRAENAFCAEIRSHSTQFG